MKNTLALVVACLFVSSAGAFAEGRMTVLDGAELAAIKGAKTCYGTCTLNVNCNSSNACGAATSSSNCSSYVNSVYVNTMSKHHCDKGAEGLKSKPCKDAPGVCGHGFKVTACQPMGGGCASTTVASTPDDMQQDICN